ncbi:MAG: glycerol-3-phosphate acyltransferase, partial [Pseudomonadota bacterium]|nr:glycerol-3-phosphate acyltransferase [Pseudomonadota bacterium]
AWWLVGWEAGVFAGTAAFVGHLYPVSLGFRGGKGVATGLGTFAAVSWPIFVGMALAWLATAAVTRRSSAGALGAFTALPLLTAVFGERAAASAIALPYWFVILGFLLAAVVWYKHRANVSRLIQGTEPAISFGGGKARAEPGQDGEGATDRGEE